MKLFGIAGHSGMGKTTLLERLVPELRARGLSVSLIKHSHKDIEIDRPGKDSYRLREAGCGEVMLLGQARWALMHELREQVHPPLEYLLSRLQSCDLVLIEGFKTGDFPKLEVWRPALFKAPLGPGWPSAVTQWRRCACSRWNAPSALLSYHWSFQCPSISKPMTGSLANKRWRPV